MIKMIATDMDGTFLDSTHEVNQEFFEVFKDLQKKNILFVVASGNQFYHLYNQFLPVSDDVYFIAENGSYITKGKQELWSSSLSNDSIVDVLNICSQFPELMIVICGKKASYIFKTFLRYDDEIKRHYDVYEFIDGIADIDDEILKFSIHDPLSHVQNYVEKIRSQLPQHLKIMTSGNEWMDIQDQSIHKGVGICFLQERFQLQKEECAAFGDQMNDYEMLQCVKWSYAMDNAVKEIKDIAYEIVLSNEEQGVLKKVKEIIEEEREC